MVTRRKHHPPNLSEEKIKELLRTSSKEEEAGIEKGSGVAPVEMAGSISKEVDFDLAVGFYTLEGFGAKGSFAVTPLIVVDK